MNAILNRKMLWTLLVTSLVAAGPVYTWAAASAQRTTFAYGCFHAKSGWMRLVDTANVCKPDEVRVELQSPTSAERNAG